MTARVSARICTACFTVITEVGPGGRCPVCALYGQGGWLTEFDDRAMIMSFMVVRAMTEPLPPVRMTGGEDGQPSRPAAEIKPAGGSLLSRRLRKMG